jgi:tellurite resistance-related uncharacterized protein
MLQVISGYWEAVGVKTQLVPMDFTAFRNAWVSKDPKIMGGVATYISFGSAANSIPAQQNHMTSKGVNFSGNDQQLDKDFFAMTAELDQSSVPAGLLKDHSTRRGVWARIVVHSGALRYHVDGMDRRFDLAPGTPGIVVPEVPHHVEPLGAVRFHVEFWAAPAAGEAS